MTLGANGRVVLLAAAMLSAVAAAFALTPHTREHAAAPPLAQLVPARFGAWHEIALAARAVDPRTQGATNDREAPYDDVLMRAYANDRGDVVVLALAYGASQRQEVKIHRPELCYEAQGFKVLKRSPVDIPLAGAAPAGGARMLVRGADRVEAVSYWIRIGDIYSRNPWRTRAHIFSEGIAGNVLDGMLVRVSQILPEAGGATAERYALQEEFLAELVQSLPASARTLFVGDAPA